MLPEITWVLKAQNVIFTKAKVLWEKESSNLVQKYDKNEHKKEEAS